MSEPILTEQELRRYSRQMILPQLGVEGQQRLKEASVLVVGAGGLGSPALFYLCAAGVGRIGVIDPDKVAESNLQRQILYSASEIGLSKASLARSKLNALNPHVEIEAFESALTRENALDLVSRFDLVVDGSDNFPTRYLVNDACVIQNRPFIYGAISQFEGQLSVFNLEHSDGTRGPTYRCLFPEPPPAELSPNCAENGVIGVLPGIIGALQANEALKILAQIGTPLSGRLQLFHALSGASHTLSLSRDHSLTQITELGQYREQCNQAQVTTAMQATQLKQLIDQGETPLLIDVREPFERQICHIGGEHIPLRALCNAPPRVPPDRQVVLYCHTGQRSAIAQRLINREHQLSFLHLEGGLLAWANEVDSNFPIY